MYLLKHAQLQMSNDRGKQAQAYPPLPLVKWITITGTGINPSERGAESDFWGAMLTVTIHADLLALERLVNR